MYACSSKGATHTICGCGRAQVKVLHTLYVGVDVLK